MKREIFLWLVFFLVVVPNAWGKARLYCPRNINLGRLAEGKVIKFSLKVSNEGDSPLIIKGVKHSCGCLKFLGPPLPLEILPYALRELYFSFNTTGYNGEVKRYIYLYSNDTQNPYFKIDVYSLVRPQGSSFFERFKGFNAGIVLFAGLIDGINPCAFTVIVFFIIFLKSCGYKKRFLWTSGTGFIFAVFLAYLGLGLGIIKTLEHIPFYPQLYALFYTFVGALALVFSFYNFYDAFVFLRTKDYSKARTHLPQSIKNKIQLSITKFLRRRGGALILLLLSLVLGFWIAVLESACTGQVYVPTIVYILKASSSYGKLALVYLLLYNIAFILPLVIVFLLGLWGITSAEFSEFMKKHYFLIKVLMGSLFLFLSAVLILIH